MGSVWTALKAEKKVESPGSPSVPRRLLRTGGEHREGVAEGAKVDALKEETQCIIYKSETKKVSHQYTIH